MLLEDVAQELIGETNHRRFKRGFERRVARSLSDQLSKRPAALEENLRLFVAVEEELAADPTCAAALQEWRSFMDTLVGLYGRARHSAGRVAGKYQRSALETVDTGLRADPVIAKADDVAAGPFARFRLQPSTSARSSSRSSSKKNSARRR